MPEPTDPRFAEPVSATRLNQNGWRIADAMIRDAERLRIAFDPIENATVLDCGVQVEGGIEAGLRLAELCLAGLGRVTCEAGRRSVWPGLDIAVATDHPVPACLGAQYAGWPLSVEYPDPDTPGKTKNYFAMASGPMRSARGKEPVLEHLGLSDRGNWGVGVLESGKLPTAPVIGKVAEECGLPSERIVLAVAPTSSIAGSVQVVSRSVETALHKLEQLGFDLGRVVSGFGVAPLPPPAKDDLAAIGRTNDAVLYGGETTLWVRGDDASLEELGAKTPSGASDDHGEPFARIFARYDHDFYKVDPLLFSPAVVRFYNLDTGSAFEFGEVRPDVLRASFRER